MPPTTLKREEHKAAVRGKISSVARKLFLEQGYQNTKMRQIKTAAGVKMGTIYHFFKNKEDILENIVMKAFFRVQERTADVTQGDQQLHLAAELAWHVHTMAQHPPSAELYMICYNSPVIAKQLLTNQIQRSRLIFNERFPAREEKDYEVYAMAARGLMQSISLQAVNGTLREPASIIRQSVSMLLKLMDTPAVQIENVLQNLESLRLAEKVTEALGSATPVSSER